MDTCTVGYTCNVEYSAMKMNTLLLFTAIEVILTDVNLS